MPPPGSRVPPATWAAYGAETQFISPDGRTVVFDARLVNGDPGSNAALRQVPALRAAVAAVARATGATAYGVAGAVPAGYDVGQVSDADLLRVFPVAIIVIGLLLALVLRSLIAPLYLIASVVISYLAAWGLSVLLFQDAARAGGLYHAIPFLMFIFLLALGEDYNILVMTRIREEASRVPLRQAVTAALSAPARRSAPPGSSWPAPSQSSPWQYAASPAAARSSSHPSRSASSWTPSSSAPCSSPPPSPCSAAGTGGHPATAHPAKPPQDPNRHIIQCLLTHICTVVLLDAAALTAHRSARAAVTQGSRVTHGSSRRGQAFIMLDRRRAGSYYRGGQDQGPAHNRAEDPSPHFPFCVCLSCADGAGPGSAGGVLLIAGRRWVASQARSGPLRRTRPTLAVACDAPGLHAVGTSG